MQITMTRSQRIMGVQCKDFKLYYGIVVMETHRFAFITMGCRYDFIQVSPHNSTTELKFHLSNQNSLPKLKMELKPQFPFPKRNGPTLYNNINIVSSSSFPRPDTCWSNINLQAGWAYIYTVAALQM